MAKGTRREGVGTTADEIFYFLAHFQLPLPRLFFVPLFA